MTAHHEEMPGRRMVDVQRTTGAVTAEPVVARRNIWCAFEHDHGFEVAHVFAGFAVGPAPGTQMRGLRTSDDAIALMNALAAVNDEWLLGCRIGEDEGCPLPPELEAARRDWFAAHPEAWQ